MAIVTEIIRLTSNRNTIRNQVLTWGLGKSTDTLSELATIISGISKQDVTATLSTAATSYTIPAGYHDGTGTVGITLETTSVTPSTTAQTVTPTSGKVLSSVSVGAIQTQTLTVTPAITSQTYTPDTGKFFSSFTVNAIPDEFGDATATDAIASDILYGKKAIGYDSSNGEAVLLTGTMPNNGSLSTTTLSTNIISYSIPAGYTTGGTVEITLETKSVTPTTSPQTVTPTSGKVLSSVSVSAIQTQTETITPTTSQQVVNPDEGKYLSQVTVNKIPENFGNATDKTATNAQILYGYTAIGYNSSTGKAIDLTGSMANNGAITASLDTETTSYTIPVGYHNGSGTVSIITQTQTVTPTTSSQTITPETGKVLASVLVNPIQTETKETTPTTSQQVITPASGKYLSSVTVNAIPIKFGDASGTDAVAANLLYGKTAIGYNSSTGAAITLTGTMPNNAPTNTTLSTATTSYTIPAGYHAGTGTVNISLETKSTAPSESPQTITPTSGKVLSSVSISAIKTETTSVTPTTSQQIITPSAADKYLKQVTVNAIPAEYGDATEVTATADKILYGETAIGYDSTEEEAVVLTGTMPNRGAVSVSLNTGTTSYTVPAGYHNGSGTVSISTETKTQAPSTSVITVTPTEGKVLSSVTVEAIKTETKTVTPTTSSQTLEPASGKFFSSFTVNAIPGNFGDATDKTATAADILSGKTAIGYNSSTGKAISLTGSMANNGAVTVDLDTETTSYTVPAGYHNGSGTVSISTETKTQTPGDSDINVTPGTGKVLSSVVVKGITYTDAPVITLGYNNLTASTSKGRYKAGSNNISVGIGTGDNTLTAKAAQILAGYRAIGSNADGTAAASVTGTMVNHTGAENVLLTTASTSYTIPAGYHAGSQVVSLVTETKVQAPGDSDITVTPTSGKVLSSVTVKGITYADAQAYTLSYSTLTASTAKGCWKAGSNNVTLSATGLTGKAAHVLAGYKVIGLNAAGTAALGFEGTMPDNTGAENVVLDATTKTAGALSNTSYTIPAGYHAGSQTVSIVTETKEATPGLTAQTIVPTDDKVLAAVTVKAIPNQQSTISYVLDATHTEQGVYTNYSKAIPVGYYASAGSVSISIDEPVFTPTFATTAGVDTYYPASGEVYGKVRVNKVITETPTITLKDVSGTTTSDTYTPTSGHLFSSVTVPRIVTETTEVTAGTSNKTVTPTDNKYLTQVIVKPTPTETKTVSPIWVSGTTTSDTYTPASGKYFSQFTVNRIDNKYQDVSGVTAGAAQVLTGYKFVTSNGTLTDGTMANNSPVTTTLDVRTGHTSYTIPAGYHNGTGVVNLSTEAKSNIDPSDSSQTITPTDGKVLSSVQINGISYSDAPTIAVGFNNLTASTVKGRYNAGTNNISISKTSLTAKAAQILTGYKAIGLNAAGTAADSVTGTMADNSGAEDVTLTTASTSYTIPIGYHDGTQKVQISTESKTVTPTNAGFTVTPTSGKVLSSVVINPITESTALTNAIIAGESFIESADGATVTDYGWKTTVTIPAGTWKSQQVLVKTFSNVLPAPDSEGTTANLLTGYTLYNHAGQAIVGAMANNGAGDTYTLDTATTSKAFAAGYWSSANTVNISLEDKTNISPSDSSQTITPTSGKVLSSVQINAITYSTAPTVTLGWGTLSASTSKGRYNAGSGNVTIGIGSGNTALTGKAAHVLEGYRVIGINSAGIAVESITGGMANNGDVSTNITIQNGTVTIPAGYTTGGTIKAVLGNATLTAKSASVSVSDTRDITLGNAQASAPATGPYIKVSGSGTVKVSADGYAAVNTEKTATATDQYYPVTNVITLELTFADDTSESYTLIGNNVTVS